MRSGSTALATERVERRLAAILAADVAGYSRLMGADEGGTLQALETNGPSSSIRRSPRNGWPAKTTGNGFLVEFSGMVDAQRCATSNASRHHGQTYMLLSGPMFRVRFSHR